MLLAKVTILISVLSNLFCLTLQRTPLSITEECNRPIFVISEECCKLPNFYTKEIKETCKEFSNISLFDEQHFKLQSSQCFTMCALNETAILDNGSLNEENLHFYLNEALADTPEMKPILADAFKHCFAITADFRKYLEPPPEGYCSFEGSFIMDCVYLRTAMFCTGFSWADTNECNDDRAYIRKCLFT